MNVHVHYPISNPYNIYIRIRTYVGLKLNSKKKNLNENENRTNPINTTTNLTKDFDFYVIELNKFACAALFSISKCT